MNLMGIRQVEPLDNVFKRVKPSLLRSALEMLVMHKVQSKEAIERMQFVPRPRLRSNGCA